MSLPIALSVPELHPEVWPRWLPGTHLRDPYTHWSRDRFGPGACGQPVMWAKPGHVATRRRCCPDCLRVLAATAGEGR
ncbi:hypothetical protein JOF55_001600 [Haloactinomyces albus]|uniref:Uncharacterized protein n=1 Tax=Haloactinomyces albus TaxID=1352928 RepID=A0AAE4CL50_9ACTN|nr:hypothetical protein [Haloactinomyces albus]